MQIKYALTYHLVGRSLICQVFYKLWKSQAFHGRRFYVQKWVLFRKFLYS
ncbi:hypothetical protein ENTCAN_08377 [Enterobacter cancerogenus ATCC 35316]|nr:hypothetical protein ENTCAN_08377 [Enterobacter cancerogenus ATCC 35316]